MPGASGMAVSAASGMVAVSAASGMLAVSAGSGTVAVSVGSGVLGVLVVVGVLFGVGGCSLLVGGGEEGRQEFLYGLYILSRTQGSQLFQLWRGLVFAPELACRVKIHLLMFNYVR